MTDIRRKGGKGEEDMFSDSSNSDSELEVDASGACGKAKEVSVSLQDWRDLQEEEEKELRECVDELTDTSDADETGRHITVGHKHKQLTAEEQLKADRRRRLEEKQLEEMFPSGTSLFDNIDKGASNLADRLREYDASSLDPGSESKQPLSGDVSSSIYDAFIGHNRSSTLQEDVSTPFSQDRDTASQHVDGVDSGYCIGRKWWRLTEAEFKPVAEQVLRVTERRAQAMHRLYGRPWSWGLALCTIADVQGERGSMEVEEWEGCAHGLWMVDSWMRLAEMGAGVPVNWRTEGGDCQHESNREFVCLEKRKAILASMSLASKLAPTSPSLRAPCLEATGPVTRRPKLNNNRLADGVSEVGESSLTTAVYTLLRHCQHDLQYDAQRKALHMFVELSRLLGADIKANQHMARATVDDDPESRATIEEEERLLILLLDDPNLVFNESVNVSGRATNHSPSLAVTDTAAAVPTVNSACVSDVAPSTDSVSGGCPVGASAEELDRLANLKARLRKVRYSQLRAHFESQQKVTGSALSSFYAASNPPLLAAARPTLTVLRDRTRALLKAYPSHPILESLLNTCERLCSLRLFHTTPVTLLTGIELVYERAQLWESSAPRMLSLHLTDLETHIVRLRQRQMDDWRHLRDYIDQRAAEGSLRYWPYLVSLISVDPSVLEDDSTLGKNGRGKIAENAVGGDTVSVKAVDGLTDVQNLGKQMRVAADKEGSTCGLVDELLRFVRVGPLGQMKARVDLLQYTAMLFINSRNHDERRNACVMLNVSRFSCLWCEAVDNHLATSRRETETRVNDLIKIARWDMSNPSALKATVHRSHRQLHKICKRYEASLQEMSDPHIASHQQASLSYRSLFVELDKTKHPLPTLPTTANVTHSHRNSNKSVTQHPAAGVQEAPEGHPVGCDKTELREEAETEREPPRFHRVLRNAMNISDNERNDCAAETVHADVLRGAAAKMSGILSVGHHGLAELVRQVEEEIHMSVSAAKNASVPEKRRWMLLLRDFLKQDLKILPVSRGALRQSGISSSSSAVISQILSNPTGLSRYPRDPFAPSFQLPNCPVAIPLPLSSPYLLYFTHDHLLPSSDTNQPVSSGRPCISVRSSPPSSLSRRPCEKSRTEGESDGSLTEGNAVLLNVCPALLLPFLRSVWEACDRNLQRGLHMFLHVQQFSNVSPDMRSERESWLNMCAGLLQTVDQHRSRCIEFGAVYQLVADLSLMILHGGVQQPRLHLGGGSAECRSHDWTGGEESQSPMHMDADSVTMKTTNNQDGSTVVLSTVEIFTNFCVSLDLFGDALLQTVSLLQTVKPATEDRRLLLNDAGNSNPACATGQTAAMDAHTGTNPCRRVMDPAEMRTSRDSISHLHPRLSSRESSDKSAPSAPCSDPRPSLDAQLCDNVCCAMHEINIRRRLLACHERVSRARTLLQHTSEFRLYLHYSQSEPICKQNMVVQCDVRERRNANMLLPTQRPEEQQSLLLQENYTLPLRASLITDIENFVQHCLDPLGLAESLQAPTDNPGAATNTGNPKLVEIRRHVDQLQSIVCSLVDLPDDVGSGLVASFVSLSSAVSDLQRGCEQTELSESFSGDTDASGDGLGSGTLLTDELVAVLNDCSTTDETLFGYVKPCSKTFGPTSDATSDNPSLSRTLTSSLSALSQTCEQHSVNSQHPRLSVCSSLLDSIDLNKIYVALHQYLNSGMLSRDSSNPSQRVLLNQVLSYSQAVLLSAFDCLEGVSALSLRVMQVVALTFEKGFCGSAGADSSKGSAGEEGGDDWIAGTGMGEGEGARDVTGELDNENQLVGLKGEDDTDDPEKEEKKPSDSDEEDTALEVSFEFDGDLENKEQLEDRKKKRLEEQMGEEEEEADRQMGDVELEEGGELEKKQWEGEDEQDDGEFDPDKSQQTEDIETQGGKNKVGPSELVAGEDEDDSARQDDRRNKPKKESQDAQEESDEVDSGDEQPHSADNPDSKHSVSLPKGKELPQEEEGDADAAESEATDSANNDADEQESSDQQNNPAEAEVGMGSEDPNAGDESGDVDDKKQETNGEQEGADTNRTPDDGGGGAEEESSTTNHNDGSKDSDIQNQDESEQAGTEGGSDEQGAHAQEGIDEMDEAAGQDPNTQRGEQQTGPDGGSGEGDGEDDIDFGSHDSPEGERVDNEVGEQTRDTDDEDGSQDTGDAAGQDSGEAKTNEQAEDDGDEEGNDSATSDGQHGCVTEDKESSITIDEDVANKGTADCREPQTGPDDTVFGVSANPAFHRPPDTNTTTSTSAAQPESFPSCGDQASSTANSNGSSSLPKPSTPSNSNSQSQSPPEPASSTTTPSTSDSSEGSSKQTDSSRSALDDENSATPPLPAQDDPSRSSQTDVSECLLRFPNPLVEPVEATEQWLRKLNILPRNLAPSNNLEERKPDTKASESGEAGDTAEENKKQAAEEEGSKGAGDGGHGGVDGDGCHEMDLDSSLLGVSETTTTNEESSTQQPNDNRSKGSVRDVMIDEPKCQESSESRIAVPPQRHESPEDMPPPSTTDATTGDTTALPPSQPTAGPCTADPALLVQQQDMDDATVADVASDMASVKAHPDSEPDSNTKSEQEVEARRQQLMETLMDEADNTPTTTKTAGGGIALEGERPESVAINKQQSVHDVEDDEHTSAVDMWKEWVPKGLTEDQAERLWRKYEAETGPLAVSLCEQLRIILEPTMRGRLQGDYRTGKRLSMRKVITFIASNYRKDKIWLRRTKPSKRAYRVIVAVDNSKSMSEAGAGPLAVQAVATICQALQKLEVGRIGVCSFGGGTPTTLVPLDTQISRQVYVDMVRAFTFDEETRSSHDLGLANMLRHGCESLDNTDKEGDVSDMIVLVTDGRFNKAKVKQWVYAAIEKRQIPLLLIIDTNGGTTKGKGSTSVFDMKQVVLQPGGAMKVNRYLEDFPFPYYAVIQHADAIGTVMTDVVRQWFEALTQTQL
eukprot:GHVQ01021671.1.p1 GENE.GHVQ01021671.1~~GHVQ01021671.1.p1  ORF type:complete len:3417 (-),score=625.88 GHVQ01021671.1:3137-11980(-)